MLLISVCKRIIHQNCMFHVSNENTMKWCKTVNMTAHFVYSILPIVWIDILSLMRSISCTALLSSSGRTKLSATHAAICMPRDECHTSIIRPTHRPINISAQRGIRTGRLMRNRIYIITIPQLPIYRWSNSSTCNANTNNSRPISRRKVIYSFS